MLSLIIATLLLLVAVGVFFDKSKILTTIGAGKDPLLGMLLTGASIAAAVFSAVIYFFAFTTTIGAGEVGIQVLFGKPQQATLTSGLNVVNPLASVVKMDTRTIEYTMSHTQNEGRVKGDDAIEIQGSDGMLLAMEITVLYRLDAAYAARMYSTVGEDYEAKIVRPEIRSVMRMMATNFTGINLYTSPNGEREQLKTIVVDKLTKGFKARNIVLEDFLIRNIDAPQAVKDAIDAKKKSEQDAERMDFELDIARKEATRKEVEAQGIARYQEIVSKNANKQSVQFKSLETLEKVAASPSSKIYIVPFKDGIPMILGSH